MRETRARALTSADRALRLDGASVSALIVRSGALARVGDDRRARAALADAARIEPESFVAHTLLGDADARLGDAAGAQKEYRRALALNPRDPTLRALAR